MERVFDFIREQRLDVSDLVVDHIALRLKNKSDVDLLRKEIDTFSIHHAPISTAEVNGRDICIYKLQDPLTYGNIEISCIELPYPKKHHDYLHDGWEHIEFVLPSSAKTAHDFEEAFVKKFPHIKNYKVDEPVTSENQHPNPSVVLEKEKGLAVKFHPSSIENVIMGSE